MLAKNETPFAGIGFEQIHRDGEAMAVIAVRGRFDLFPDGALKVAAKQKILVADEYQGEPVKTPLLRTTDLAPFKPFADITVLGTAEPPRGKRSTTWWVSMRVGALEHHLRVHGGRYWEPDGLLGQSWKLGEVEEGADFVPLDYTHSAGGPILGDPAQRKDERNPLGVGVIDAEHTRRGERYRAPIVEHHTDVIHDPFGRPEPMGLYPVPPWWPWRARYLGTRDAAWRKERFPRYPADFDYRFFQTAHPKLIMGSYLGGNEGVELIGLTRGHERVIFHLPGKQPWVIYQWEDGRKVSARLNCDGLHLDMRQGPPWRVDLTWRGWIVSCPQFWKMEAYLCGLQEAAHLPRSNEYGLAEA